MQVKLKLVLFIPAIAWFITIFVLLVMPNDDIPSAHLFDIIYFDKWVHAGIFGLEVILVSWPFFKTQYASTKLFFKITIGVILYGVAMEFVQKYLTSDRDYDTFDMLADAAGSLIAFALVNWRYKKFVKKMQGVS